MEFGQAARPAPVGSAAIIGRVDAGATQGGVPVELPPSRTVQSSLAGEPLRLDIGTGDPSLPRQQALAGREKRTSGSALALVRTLERNIAIDQETQTVVVEKTDPETGETVETMPDEMMLRSLQANRAFIERAQAGSDAHPASVERMA